MPPSGARPSLYTFCQVQMKASVSCSEINVLIKSVFILVIEPSSLFPYIHQLFHKILFRFPSQPACRPSDRLNERRLSKPETVDEYVLIL